MLGGFSSEPTGLIVFATIKLIGYSAFAFYLNRLFPDSAKNFLLVGCARTVIGLAFGSVLTLIGFVATMLAGPIGIILYILVLIPVRFLEWSIVVNGMYKIKRTDPNWKEAIGAGIIWSFILDVPALIGFFSTGGFWIC